MRAYSAIGLLYLQGDYVDMPDEDIAKCAAVFDRAALVALPRPMRERYAEKMSHALASGAKMMLITLEYDQRLFAAPPFAISKTWDINPRWSAAALYHYTGEAVQSTLDDYHLLDLSVNRRLANHWRIALSADNVFEEDYYTAVGFPCPGVGIRLGLNYALH
ncbi:hypothetical protein BST95_12560 [Halioglobus japonicus]|uniref:TonB-dependent receptor n=1 Tax=Halioglobus japonicus TaxID=930805 RepID=A0AAP8MID7_9GAMM|nr:hypothetical protein BST95_12560 [Halioglobus japonicus]PLW88039.1 TonB-dependent receptor [Halioglobus japonicus]GHD20547.1 hypothetical protein GCM10007052_30350 [Halioglobus japonicus]